MAFDDTAAVRFFLEHAGWGYDPATETPEDGRHRGAVALAKAEAWLVERPGFTVKWEQDRDYDPKDYDCGDMPDVGWSCFVSDGLETESLHGITFDGDGEPWGNPYARVVVAELALDLMPD